MKSGFLFFFYSLQSLFLKRLPLKKLLTLSEQLALHISFKPNQVTAFMVQRIFPFSGSGNVVMSVKEQVGTWLAQIDMELKYGARTRR